MRGNVILGLVGGIVAGLIGAIIWTGITVTTGYQIGWIAIGVGFLVGIAVRLTGKGDAVVFGIIGAVCALLSCMTGNLLSGVVFLSQAGGIDPVEGLTQFDYSMSFEILEAMFSPIDLLFYGLAVYQGFKISIFSEEA